MTRALPLIERTAELAALDQRVRDAVAGVGGSAVVVGPPGIGKSALLAATAQRAGELGALVLHARCNELEAEFPYGAILQLLDRLVHDDPELVGSGAAGLTRPVFGLAGAQIAPSEVRHTLVYGLYWLTCAVAERQPLVILVDDVQWIDEPSRRYLHYLVRRLEGLPITVVCALRDDSPEMLASVEVAVDEAELGVLRPALLSVEGTRTLLAGATEDTASAAFASACHTASGGNPFLLRELLAAVRAEDRSPDDDSALSVPRLTPEGVTRSVLRRLRALPDETRQVAHAVAILGDGAEARHVAAVVGTDIAAVARNAELLVGQSILRREGGLGVEHPVVAEALRSALAFDVRSDLHLASARTLADDGAPVEQVARHLLRTERVGEPWVIETLRSAAAGARRAGALSAGVHLLRRALEENPVEHRDALLFELGELEWLAGETQAADHLRASHDPRAALALMRVLMEAVDLNGAVEIWEQARSDGLDVQVLTRMRAELSSLMPYEFAPRLFTASELERFSEIPGTTPDEILLLCNAAMWHGLAGRRERAVELAMRAVRSPAFLAGEGADRIAQTITASVFIWSDDHDLARTTIEAIIADSSARGSVQSFTYGTGLQSVLGYYGGDLDLCASAADAGSTVGDSVPLFLPVLGGSQALVALERGEYDLAAQILEAIDMSEPAPTAHARLARARLAQIRGRADEALEEYRIIGTQVGSGNRVPWPAWQIGSAEVLVAAGDRTTAAALVAGYRELADAWGTDSVLGMALRGDATVAGGTERVDLLRASADTFGRSASRLEHARSLLLLGLQLRIDGYRDDARAVLTEAVDVAGSCAAIALQQRAVDELVVAGGRPRRLRTTGADALTPSERRVAALVARELTNTQVAQSLFVTRSTVEKHVASILRKLGISSRTEIGAHLLD